jgi:DNA-binding transcriptional regulator LsrR (DeoR family)
MSDNKIIDLYKKGLSRKLIAKNLGISEWKVRCAIRQQHTKVIKAKEFKTNEDIRLSKVSVSKSPELKKAIILSDIHVPYHDQAALSVALAYAKDYAPDMIVLNGDIIDFYGASSYRQDSKRFENGKRYDGRQPKSRQHNN